MFPRNTERYDHGTEWCAEEYDRLVPLDQVDGSTFVLSEYRHWEQTHCYLLSLEKVSALPASRIFPGHHSLDIRPEIIGRMLTAFQRLDAEGKPRPWQRHL